jgi:hypothetical protein
MSWISYTSFPRELKAVRVSEVRGREKEFGIDYDISLWQDYVYLFPNKPLEESRIVVVDKKDARFDNCFENKFVYKLSTEIHDDTKEQRAEIVNRYYEKKEASGYLDDENMNQELRKYWEIDWRKARQIMYDFTNEHINYGEFVEIYSAWDNHEGEVFLPPTIEQSMTLQEYLDRPIDSERPNSNERYKLTIHKTV